MGRKIPGKKHHGVKDPEAQRARREEALKLKINSLPKILDDQEVPKKLRLMMQKKEQLKLEQTERRKKLKEKKNEQKTSDDEEASSAAKKVNKDLLDSSKHMGFEMRLPGMKKPLKPVPVFKQEPGETQRKFLSRVEVTVQQFLKQRNFEEKFSVDLVQDSKTGRTKFIDKPKDELEEEMAQKKRDALAKKGIVVRSKEEKRQLRRQKEKERKSKKKRRRGGAASQDEDFPVETARPAFNEVAHQPPTLKPPRGAHKNTEVGPTRRPGSKNLLLLEKLKSDKAENKKKASQLSLAAKERLRLERERVIEQYRLLKKQKHSL